MYYIRELRESTKLSQSKFADMFQIPVSTLRKWEQNESRPPKYIINLIKKVLPCDNKNYKAYLGSDGKYYYLDEENKRVADSLGNWIQFQEDISGVIEDNIIVYIETLFNKYYESVKEFNNELKVDKIQKIKWR